MPEYISGSPESMELFRAQCGVIYDTHPYARFVGSFCRAAMYAAYDWEAPPLSLADAGNVLRDIDLMATTQMPGQSLYETKPHPIDIRLNNFVDYGNPAALQINEVRLWLSPQVVNAVTRNSLGFPMRTFSVGTQLHIESLVVNSAEKYQRSREAFAQFAAWVRENHPNEFLPEEYYKPFRELRRLNEAARSHWR